jgi:hypothetical protein
LNWTPQANGPFPFFSSYESREISQNFIHSLFHSISDLNRVQIWSSLKSLASSGQTYDPLSAKCSYSSWRKDAAPLRTVRTLVMAKFSRSFTASMRSHIFGGSKLCKCGSVDSQLHILGACPLYSGLYTLRHDAAVRRIASFLRVSLKFPFRILVNVSNTSRLKNRIPLDLLSTPGTHCPDIILIDAPQRRIFFLEVSISADSNISAAYLGKRLKPNSYGEVAADIRSRGWTCDWAVVILGHLGLVPVSVVRLFDQLSTRYPVPFLQKLSRLVERHSRDILTLHTRHLFTGAEIT